MNERRVWVCAGMVWLLSASGCSDAAPVPGPSDGDPAGASETLTRARSLLARYETLGPKLVGRVPAAEGVRREPPPRADRPARVEHVGSRIGLGFRLRGALPVVAERVDGIDVYPRALPGASWIVAETAEGIEDFVVFESAPAAPLEYEVDVTSVAGVRFLPAPGVLELLDTGGAPRLRVSAPFAIDADGKRVALAVSVSGCAYDSDPRAPHGRAVVPPASPSCRLRVDFEPARVRYPLLVDPAWTTTGNMSFARSRHGAARLPSGKVLVTGGAVPAGNSMLAELYDPATGTWANTASMAGARIDHSELTLPSGKVLVCADAIVSQGELYDETTGSWAPTGAMIKSRWNKQGILLASGKVLIAGGFGGFVPKTAELYDPATGTWSDAGTMVDWRNGHVLIELADGRVLAAGGREDQGGQVWKTAEIYSPATNSWTALPSMASFRLFPGALRLPNGRILISGGYKETLPFEQGTTEIYDPVANTWTAGPSMTKTRYHHTVTKLATGKFLFASSYLESPNVLTSEYFDPATNTFTPLSNLKYNHAYGTATLLADGRVLVVGGGNIEKTAELFAFAANGQSCTVAADCQSGQCVEGVCCSSACNGACESCLGSKTGAATGICSPVSANTDPDSECGACKTCNAGACTAVAAGNDPKNDCKDSGSPSCQQNGSCDGAGACELYAVSAGCTPTPCSSGSECASGYCRDGVCCDTACNGPCQACTAAKKGSGVDGVCEPVAADTDPDDECAEGPNYPTSCLADGMCDGSGACRVFAKDTVSCGATQCIGGTAQGLLCNGAGSCVTATKSCEPYICESNQCLQACSDANDCAAGSFCSSSGACLPKQANGLGCTAGKECQSGFCADGLCCDQACSGQCEACNVAPNEGTCSPVIGAPVGTRPPCEGEGECGGQCDGVDRTACKVPPSGKACGSASCALDKATASKCDGLGACVAATSDCSPFSCGGDACRTTCSASEHCAEGFVCNPETGNCVPAAGTCAPDGVTLELANGETKSCAPYRCLAGECADPCVTSSQCVEGYACDQSKCVLLGDSAAADEGGCGCRTAPHGRASGLAWAALLAMVVASRRRRRVSLRKHG